MDGWKSVGESKMRQNGRKIKGREWVGRREDGERMCEGVGIEIWWKRTGERMERRRRRTEY